MATGPIQIPVPGLLGFLQLKNAGRNPRDLVDSIQPVFNVLEWYLMAQREFISGSTDAHPAGTTGYAPSIGAGEITVPSQEWWYVHNVRGSTGLLPNTDVVSYALACVPDYPTSTANAYVIGHTGVGQAAGTDSQIATFADRTFFAPPGTNFGAWLNWIDIVAGAEGISLVVQFTRLPI